MDLQQWRARQAGEAYILPSGLDVRLKKVSMIDLAQGGKIPQTLHAPVNELMKRDTKAGVSIEGIAEFRAVLDLVVGACMVEPADLDVSELPWDDKLAIFNWANAPAEKLVPFRREQDGAVESAFTVGELRPEAQPNHRGR